MLQPGGIVSGPAPVHDPGQGRLAAVAAIGATGLALALVACPAAASTKPAWRMTASNVRVAQAVDTL